MQSELCVCVFENGHKRFGARAKGSSLAIALNMLARLHNKAQRAAPRFPARTTLR